MRNCLLLFFVFTCSGCEYFDLRMHVINQTSLNISVYETNDTSEAPVNNLEYYQSNVIHPKDTSFLVKSGKNEWINYIKQSPQKRIYLYFFNLDTLNKYLNKADMNYLIGNKKYLKRMDFTLDELNNINWEVKYN